MESAARIKAREKLEAAYSHLQNAMRILEEIELMNPEVKKTESDLYGCHNSKLGEMVFSRCAKRRDEISEAINGMGDMLLDVWTLGKVAV
jgi:hypothetical protein